MTRIYTDGESDSTPVIQRVRVNGTEYMVDYDTLKNKPCYKTTEVGTETYLETVTLNPAPTEQ